MAVDDNPKTVFGNAKPSMFAVPNTALICLGLAMDDGRRKYGLMNWREHPVSASTYIDAIDRHKMAWVDSQEVADDSGVHHLAHIMACCAILIDAQLYGTMKDDRPIPGQSPELIKALTKPLTGDDDV